MEVSLIFVSELYTGSISDRQLVSESGFLDLLSTLPLGKSIMADGGFEIQDLLVSFGTLDHSTFQGPKELGSSRCPEEAKKITRLHIHVE